MRSNWRQMLMSTPLSRLIVRHSCDLARGYHPSVHRRRPPAGTTAGRRGPSSLLTCAVHRPSAGFPSSPSASGSTSTCRPGRSTRSCRCARRRPRDGGARRRDGRSSCIGGAARVDAGQADVIGVRNQLALLVATGLSMPTDPRRCRSVMLEMAGLDSQFRSRTRLHVLRRHVVVGVRSVVAVVQVEKSERVEVGDDRTRPGGSC